MHGGLRAVQCGRDNADVHRMSALPPKADIDCHDRHVRLVPKADIR
jgi:hypothetical protein